MASFERLMTVTAIVKANADEHKVTDIYQLAAELQQQFPDLCPNELIKLIEQAVVTIGGAAVWMKPESSHQ